MDLFPSGLVGAVVKTADATMIEHGWLQRVDANLRQSEPRWREIGDGRGARLFVTNTGLVVTPVNEDGGGGSILLAGQFRISPTLGPPPNDALLGAYSLHA